MRGLTALLMLLAAPALADECLTATYITPCGTSAWQLGDGKTVALVRGRGSPNRLSEEVLIAGSQFKICGHFAEKPVEDAECGSMPVFLATSFSVQEPLQRRSCLLDECRVIHGAAQLTNADLDSPGTLRCAPGSIRCTIR